MLLPLAVVSKFSLGPYIDLVPTNQFINLVFSPSDPLPSPPHIAKAWEVKVQLESYKHFGQPNLLCIISVHS